VGFVAPVLGGFLSPFTQSIKAGIEGSQQQKRALAAQERAQKDAETMAQRQMRENAEALRRANAKQPDASALLADAQSLGKRGVGSTLLTGVGGVDPSSLKLGRSSLLGQ